MRQLMHQHRELRRPQLKRLRQQITTSVHPRTSRLQREMRQGPKNGTNRKDFSRSQDVNHRPFRCFAKHLMILQKGPIGVRADERRSPRCITVRCRDTDIGDRRPVDNLRKNLSDVSDAVVRFEKGAVGRRRRAAVHVGQDSVSQVVSRVRDQGLEEAGVGPARGGLTVVDLIVAARCVIGQMMMRVRLGEGEGDADGEEDPDV